MNNENIECQFMDDYNDGMSLENIRDKPRTSGCKIMTKHREKKALDSRRR